MHILVSTKYDDALCHSILYIHIDTQDGKIILYPRHQYISAEYNKRHSMSFLISIYIQYIDKNKKQKKKNNK